MEAGFKAGFYRTILTRGASLASRTRLVFLVTILTLLVEPFLPSRSWFVASMDRSLWDSLHASIASQPLLVLSVSGIAVALNIAFSCWFTHCAFEVRGGAAAGDRPSLFGFALRYAASLIALLTICAAGAALLL